MRLESNAPGMTDQIATVLNDPLMLLVVEVGSTAHGTGLPNGEDFDMIAVRMETPEEVFSTTSEYKMGAKSKMYRTQPEGERSGPGDIDLTVHPLRRFLALAASGNPSILMCLWSPVIQTTPLGSGLRTIAPYFVGRHAIPRYRGYMQSQTSRLLGVGGGKHGKRGGGQRPELIEAHGYDTKYAMHAARLGIQCVELMETGRLSFPIPDGWGDWLREVRNGNVPFEDWWKQVEAVDYRCKQLLDDDRLPALPATEAITMWSHHAHQLFWLEKGWL